VQTVTPESHAPEARSSAVRSIARSVRSGRPDGATSLIGSLSLTGSLSSPDAVGASTATRSREFASRALPWLGLAAAMTLFLTGCVEAPPRRPPPVARTAPPPEPAPEAPPPSTQVYVYPTGGQSTEQLSRDRYECYLWGVKQSGFDPSQTSLAPHQRVEVVPVQPPAANTAAGAVAGAIIGAVIAGPRDAGAGAIGGAIVGGVAGAASDAQREERIKQVQNRYDQRDNARTAQLEQQAGNYRRALTACLEGRGYTVK